MTPPTRLDRFIGCILGLAAGDALGFPVEFIRRDAILAAHGPQGVTEMLPSRHHPAGTFTDDTQMTLALAQGLLDAWDGDLDARMTAVARRFVAWAESPDNDRAPGGTCLAGCSNLALGTPWRQAGVPHSKGCGSAMRVAAIGLLYDDLDEVAAVARASSLLTHGHPAAVEGAAAAALLVALALRGEHPAAIYDAILARCDDGGDFTACMKRLPGLLDAPPAVALAKGGLGEAWVAEEAVASALYCAWRHPDDLEAALVEAVNTDGDSDSIGAIAGSLLGARLGHQAIPRRWLAPLESRDHLIAVAKQLYALTPPGA